MRVKLAFKIFWQNENFVWSGIYTGNIQNKRPRRKFAFQLINIKNSDLCREKKCIASMHPYIVKRSKWLVRENTRAIRILPFLCQRKSLAKVNPTGRRSSWYDWSRKESTFFSYIDIIDFVSGRTSSKHKHIISTRNIDFLLSAVDQ